MINVERLGQSKIRHPVDIIEDFQQGSNTIQTPMNPLFTNPIKTGKNTMNNFKEEIINNKEFLTPIHFKGTDSFYMCCLYFIDKSTPCVKLIDAKVTLKLFKRDLIKHLTSEKNLYIKLGFNRKKKLTPELLESYIDNNDSIDINVATYLSRLLKIDFVFINHNKKPTVISKKEHTESIIFINNDENYKVHKNKVNNTELDKFLK